MNVEVHKFGGTSLADASRIAACADLIAARAVESKVVLVASAMAGTTDDLLDICGCALEGERQAAQARLDALCQRHSEALQELGGDEDTHAELETIYQQLREASAGIASLCELSPRIRDRVAAAGEKLAVRLLRVALARKGAATLFRDSDTFLETDDRFGHATPLYGVVENTICKTIEPLLQDAQVVVVTGFSGQAPDGSTTTLGRGGSDYSAGLIAGAMTARELVIWTDVDGVYSADPSWVTDVRRVAQMNYREAAELSYYGAKVLHQRTIAPVASAGVPLHIRSSLDPEAPGTVVDGTFTPGPHPVKAIGAITGQSLISVEGGVMAGIPGIAARLFGCLADAGISITMISQGGSEASICIALPEEQGLAAELALKRGFRTDLTYGTVGDIVLRPRVTLVACVGLGMAHTPGVAGRVFQALGTHSVNVLAIAQGSSELNITLAVDRDDGEEAVRNLHQEFELHRDGGR